MGPNERRGALAGDSAVRRHIGGCSTPIASKLAPTDWLSANP